MRTILAMLVLCSVVAPAATHRSTAAKTAFVRQHACPSTGLRSFYQTRNGVRRYVGCPGYVIDHVKPLCAGGADSPANMQWQTKAAAAKKDVLEKRECAAERKRGCYFWGGREICSD